jgi:hypothetical protein
MRYSGLTFALVLYTLLLASCNTSRVAPPGGSVSSTSGVGTGGPGTGGAGGLGAGGLGTGSLGTGGLGTGSLGTGGLGVGGAGGSGQPFVVTDPTGASVEIPPGASPSPASVHVDVVTTGYPSLPAGTQLAGAVYGFTPHGSQFSQPVKITIPFTGVDTPKLYTADPGGAFSEVPGAQVVGNTLQASVTHFSFFVPLVLSVWQDVTGALPTSYRPAFAFMCGSIFAGGAGAYISNDGGLTWIAASSGLPANTIIYGLTTKPGTSWLFAATNQGVFRTTCGAITWTALNGVANGWPQDPMWHVPLVAGAVGATATALYAGVYGGGAVQNNQIAGLYISSNQGVTWSRIDGYVNFLANDSNIRTFAFDPGRILVGTFNLGVQVSTDGGTTWTQSEIEVLNGTTVNKLLVHGGQVYADTFDGLYRSPTGTGNWTRLATNLLPNFVPLYGLTSIGNRLVADLAYKGIRYSDDGGTTWVSYSSGLPTTLGGSYPESWSLETDGINLIGSALVVAANAYRVFQAPFPP